MEQGYPRKKFRLDKLQITVSISNCEKDCFQLRFLQKAMKNTC